MSLRLKFGILLGVIALAVTLAVGASWWAFATMQSEISQPFRGMSMVLTSLGRVKEQIEVMRHPSPSLADGESAFALARLAAADFAEAELARAAMDDEDASEWMLRAGRTALDNLRNHLGDATREVRIAAHSARDLNAAEVARLSDVRELIERLEGKLVGETARSLDFSDFLRTRLLFILLCAVAIVLLAATLGIVLMRRWVLMPVAQLRIAAARIAEGEFTHRIPVPAGALQSDELARLSREVNHMAGMIKTMQDDLVERERLVAVGEMVRRIAHNLRNPLGGIRGLAELTRGELRTGHAVAPSVVTEIRENQDRIITSVDRFEQWLNELLSVTRPTEVVPVPTEIAPWLQGLVAAHQPLARTRGVDLTVSIDDGLKAAEIDARHLEHAVAAILCNAIDAAGSPEARKTCPSPLVRIDACRVGTADAPASGSAWCIAITDTGVGINPDMREKIFRPYFTTKRDGNGIGLAIAQQVVKAHAGRIVVSSPPSAHNGPGNTPGGVVLGTSATGTCFTIELPMNRPVLASESE